MTFNFHSGQQTYFVLPLEAWEELFSKHDLEKDLFDLEQSPWGCVPYSVSVDLYEDARLRQVSPEHGTIEYLIGSKSVILEGEKLETIKSF